MKTKVIHAPGLSLLQYLLFATVLICSSCGSGAALDTTADTPDFPLPPLDSLNSGPPRGTSVEETQTRTGANAFEQSHAVGVEGSTATLDGIPDRLVWQIFEFDVFPPAAPVRLEVQAGSTTPSDPWWIAVSDYETGKWEFIKRTAADATLSAAVLPDQFGNGSNAYVAIIAYRNTVTVDSVSLISELNPVAGPWHHTWGTDIAIEGGTSMALDSQGNIYAVGLAGEMEDGHYGHLIMLKYAPDGTLLYAYNWYIPDAVDSGELAEGMDVYISPTDEVFIAGTVRSEMDTDAILMKLDSGLTPLWCARWGEDQIERTSTMTASPDGQTIHLVGYTESYQVDGTSNPFLLSIAASDGFLQQSSVFASDDHSYLDYVAAEADGELHLAGGTEGSGDFDQGIMVKVLANGDMAWARTTTVSNITAVSYDNSGNSVFSVAELLNADFGSPTVEALLFLKLDAAGDLIDSTGFEHPDSDMICAHMYRVAGGFELPCNMRTEDGENFGVLNIGDDLSLQRLLQVFSSPFQSFNSKTSGNAILFVSIATDESVLGPEPVLVENLSTVDPSSLSIETLAITKTPVIYDYGEETSLTFTQEGSEDTPNSTADIYVARAEFDE